MVQRRIFPNTDVDLIKIESRYIGDTSTKEGQAQLKTSRKERVEL
jgi:hypothetical protein